MDVASSVLGNRFAGREVARRMLATRAPGDFRDGLPYAHGLMALTRTLDRIAGAAWEESLSNRWLLALREWSGPNPNGAYPEAMRTRAWSNHTLNTPLASYAGPLPLARVRTFGVGLGGRLAGLLRRG